MAYPRIKYQRVECNKQQAEWAVALARRRRNTLTPSIHEASAIAGEFIAARNNGNGDPKLLKDVAKHYNPKYLEDTEL